MKTWAVSNKWFETQVAVIAETRNRAKVLAMCKFFDEDYIDLRCFRVKSPIPVEGPERVIEEVQESLWYGFRWNEDTMEMTFPGWCRSWLCEVSP